MRSRVVLVIAAVTWLAVAGIAHQAQVFVASRDDAAVFVASHGTKRGPWLETALRWLHEQHPQIAASDLELAEAILVQ